MTLETKRSALLETRMFEDPAVTLEDGQCRLRIDHFALTTNNITYGVFGDMMRYWEVFPALDSPEAWGRIPTWGFAEVIESRCDDVPVGERIFGFLPMSAETVISPGRIDERGLSDVAPHRSGLAGAYNRYQRTSTDPTYRSDREFHQMVLFPLFFTSFVIDDFLADNEDFGAEQLLISSASSKTSIGVAWLAQRRGLPTVGLTSPSNIDFVEGLGIYTHVIPYGEVGTLDRRPSDYIDVAGNQDLLFDIHSRFEGMLGHSMIVGNTNWDHVASPHDDLPAPTPAFFFAPTQIAKRTKDWGREELNARIGRAWHDYAEWCESWIEFVPASGPDAITDVYRTLVTGRPDPAIGNICSFQTGDPS